MLAADNTAQMCSRCLREQSDQLLTPPQYKSDFFEAAEFRAAFATHHIGKVIKVYRHHPHHLQLFGKALNQETVGRWLGLNQGGMSKLENGSRGPNQDKVEHYAKVLHLPQHLLWFDFPGQSRLTSPQPSNDADRLIVVGSSDNGDLHESLTDALAPMLLSDAGLDDWEQHILRLGRATRYRSASSLVADLSSDIDELRKMMRHSTSPDLSRRLARGL